MHYRLSLDTFYFGLSFDEFAVDDFLKFLKKNLFFLKRQSLSDKFCRNRFYKFELVNEEYGFYCFLVPRSNCKNDMVTVQLGGKFFKNVKLSKQFINNLYYDYYGLIEYQRVDVALDVIYEKDVIDSPADWFYMNFTKNNGFPVPSYSEEWKNRRITFETYGRLNGEDMFINMIASGRDDFRLRVYDKSLDLMEKYKSSYDSYYGIKSKKGFEAFKVFRIECQVRSDKLKVFIDNCNIDETTRIMDYDSLCYNFLYYLLYKYDFMYIDKKYLLGNDFYISNMNIKTESTLEGRKAYNKKMMFSYYKKFLDNCNEQEFIKEEELRLRNIFNKVKLQNKKDAIHNETEEEILQNNPFNKNYEELLNMDLSSEVIKNENIPF